MFAAIDLGASGSRVCTDNGLISVLPNSVTYLPVGQVSELASDVSEIEFNLEVQIEKLGDTTAQDIFPANVLMGTMAERYRGTPDRPKVDAHKYMQRINYISSVVSVAVMIMKYGTETARFEGDVPVVSLYLAVPPIEHSKAGEVFKEKLVGKYKVTFHKFEGGKSVTFIIDDVFCERESMMAVTSFIFSPATMRPKDETKEFMKDYLVSVDIGASTTDIIAIKDGQFLDKTGQTFKTGGNILRDNVANMLTQKYGFSMPDEAVDKAIMEGRLQMGNNYEDISDILDIAKSEFAKSITTHLPAYFNRVGIPIQMIKGMLVSGGGSLASQYINDNGEVVETSKSMSHYVTEDLKATASGLRVIQYGGEARFANIKGLFVRARVLEKIKERKRAQAQAQAAANTASAATQAVAAQTVQPTPVASVDTGNVVGSAGINNTAIV